MDRDNEPRRGLQQPDPAHDAGYAGDGTGSRDDALMADRLAGYTDAVLAGRAPDPAAAPELAHVVEALAARAKAAGVDGPVHPARQRRLKATIMEAWDQAHTPWWVRARTAVEARVGQMARAVRRQPGWGAAIALLVVACGVLLLGPLGALEPAPGTAVGPVGPEIWIGLGVAAVAAAVVIWVLARRRK